MSALELSTSYSTVIISFRFNCFRLIAKNNHKNILVLHLTNVPNHCKRVVDASFFHTCCTFFASSAGLLVALSTCDP